MMMDFSEKRQSILIYQTAGTLGILVAAWGRLDPTVITPDGKRMPHWAVSSRANIEAIVPPDSWLKMAGVAIALKETTSRIVSRYVEPAAGLIGLGRPRD